MHLRVKFFRGGGGVLGPGNGLVGEVVGAALSIPGVVAAGPGQLLLEGGNEVVQGPSHDRVVVGGDVESYDADGIANSYGEMEKPNIRTDASMNTGYFTPLPCVVYWGSFLPL